MNLDPNLVENCGYYVMLMSAVEDIMRGVTIPVYVLGDDQLDALIRQLMTAKQDFDREEDFKDDPMLIEAIDALAAEIKFRFGSVYQLESDGTITRHEPSSFH
jgi:hypothetical protein